VVRTHLRPLKFVQLDSIIETLIWDPGTTAGNHPCMRPDYLDEALAHQNAPCIGKALRLRAVVLIAAPDRDKRRLAADPGPWRGVATRTPGRPSVGR
jgi:hypothetical protein